MLVSAVADPVLTWNLHDDVGYMLMFPFMVNAFRAGVIVAVTAGLIGWFMVLRGQAFAGHTLAVVGFPGAAGATLLGISATSGLLFFTLVAALLIALVPRARADSQESAVIGTIQAFALASGFLFVHLYGGFLDSANSILFGSFLGVTAGQVVLLGAVSLVVLGVLGGIARPLLFASVDPDVAAVRGVPVRALSAVFLVLLGVAAAEASQITGTLLVFALLVAPAAAAQALSPRPAVAALLSVLIACLITCGSLTVAFYSANLPVGFLLTSAAFGCWLLARAWRHVVAQ